MKILDRSPNGCPMCQRIPVLNEDDYDWMKSGQPLHSLIAEAAEKAKNEPEVSAEIGGEDAVDAMNSAMDNLEALFGFGDSQAAAASSDDLDNVTAEDTNFEKVFYQYEEKFYVRAARRDYPVGFCAFCGSKLS